MGSIGKKEKSSSHVLPTIVEHPSFHVDSVPGGSNEDLGSGRARPGKKTGILREEGRNAELIVIPGSPRRAAGLVAVTNTLGPPVNYDIACRSFDNSVS